MSATEKIGKERGYAVFIILLVATISFAAVNFYVLNVRHNEDRQTVELTDKVAVLSQQMARFARESVRGSALALGELKESHTLMVAVMRQLRKATARSGMVSYAESPSRAVIYAVTRVDDIWEKQHRAASHLLASKTKILDAYQRANVFFGQLPSLKARMRQVMTVLHEQHAPTDQVLRVSRQILLMDRINRYVQDVLQGVTGKTDVSKSLLRDLHDLGDTFHVLRDGDAPSGVHGTGNARVDRLLADMQQSWNGLREPFSQLAAVAHDLIRVNQASDQILLYSRKMLMRSDALIGQVEKLSSQRIFPNVWWGISSIVAAMFLALWLVIVLVGNQRRRLAISMALNRRNQRAIMLLLDEMTPLAAGDLTMKMTVSEEITGAIADSVNYAIEELDTLVTAINEISEKVSSCAGETQGRASQLAQAAQKQEQQISTASTAINQVASLMDNMSKAAAESVEVAEHSEETAAHGAVVVRDTISGMNLIRDQIQETSKRIKRLGESSQEIGLIVDLINDISERTNVIALNAAIHAVSAGEVGQGFAVVADEVQQLAERSVNATRRIESLVQTIQSDVNEAVHSMEQTTTEVVTGAGKAEDAGIALSDMERVSHDLSTLIQGISTEARQQVTVALDISQAMDAIQAITAQTSQGTNQTAESITYLAQLATDLRRSVAHFKLPD